LSQDFVIPESKNSIALLIQPFSAVFIGFPRRRVLTAIEFDRQHFVEADEIGDIRTDRALAAEFEVSDLLLAQVPPQGALGIGHVLAKVSREGLGIHFLINHRIRPSLF
jgi:hypothetical protein